jgi:hypothetical protein
VKLRACIGVLALALVVHLAAHAQDAPAARPSAAASRVGGIPYKQDEDVGASLGRVGIGLVIALGVGIAALAGYKRLALPQTGGRRMRLIETLRLGPKAAIFLVEVDGRTLLIGQQGDTLAVLETPKEAA